MLLLLLLLLIIITVIMINNNNHHNNNNQIHLPLHGPAWIRPHVLVLVEVLERGGQDLALEAWPFLWDLPL